MCGEVVMVYLAYSTGAPASSGVCPGSFLTCASIRVGIADHPRVMLKYFSIVYFEIVFGVVEFGSIFGVVLAPAMTGSY